MVYMPKHCWALHKLPNHMIIFKRKFWESNKTWNNENKINEIWSKSVNWKGLKVPDSLVCYGCRGTDRLRLPIAWRFHGALLALLKVPPIHQKKHLLEWFYLKLRPSPDNCFFLPTLSTQSTWKQGNGY